ncbi:uncharacterized protein SCHCODRAFT_02484815 [Schizophyllum commune H4-8]|nr:uncharacterized protein SCHCODRAFT_02484815 [Schizophyllum commune H4-8]KAI5899662.1 hypothetical protein SCHCODRAFT_02484815 [Schizophyllum commune H4-8]
MADNWKTVLQRYAEMDPEQIPKAILFYATEHNLVIFDRYNKSIFHLLIIPRTRPPHYTAARLKNLRTLFQGDKQRAKELIDHMKEDSEELIKKIEEWMLKSYKFKWDVWVGFHAVQSLDHVHLHVISADMQSEHLKNKKHYNSFHPKLGFFIHLDDILDWFEAVPSVWRKNIELNPAFFEPLLKKDLECYHCYEEFRNMPQLTKHLKEHWEKLKAAGIAKMQRKKMIEDAMQAAKEKEEEKKKKEEERGAAEDDAGVEDGGERDADEAQTSEVTGKGGQKGAPKKTAESELGTQGQGGKDGTPSKRPSAEPAPEDSEPPAQKRTRLQDPDPSWQF